MTTVNTRESSRSVYDELRRNTAAIYRSSRLNHRRKGWTKLELAVNSHGKEAEVCSVFDQPLNLSSDRCRVTGQVTRAKYLAFFSCNCALGCRTLSLSARERLHVHAYRWRVLFATRFPTSHTLHPLAFDPRGKR